MGWNSELDTDSTFGSVLFSILTLQSAHIGERVRHSAACVGGVYTLSKTGGAFDSAVLEEAASERNPIKTDGILVPAAQPQKEQVHNYH